MTKITMESALLAKVLGDVKDVAARDSALPIASHVLVRVEGGQLSVRATNFDVEIIRMIPLDQPDCAFCVDARRFAAIASALPSGSQVALTVGDGNVSVVAGRSRFRLGSLDPASFPVLPFEGCEAVTVGADFFQALAIARPAVLVNSAGAAWAGGVFVGTRDGALWIVATDRNRLTAVKLDPMTYPEAIFSPETVDLVTRIGRDALFSIADNKVRFDFGDLIVTAKLIDGTFAQFARIIPGDTPHTVTFEGDDALSALTRIALVAEDKDRTVQVAFGAEAMELSNRSNADQGSEDIPAAHKGDDLSASFRLQYLREALQAVDGEEVVWHITDATAPTKFINPKRPTVIAVVMPTT